MRAPTVQNTLATGVGPTITAKGVGIANAPTGLFALREPECAAAIWHREPSPAFQSWIDALPPAQLPNARVILRPSAVKDTVRELCEQAGTPDCAARESLIEDIAVLADVFAQLMEAPFVRVRLDVVTDNACRKFHIDAVTARLVCTYRGTGTQYGTAPRGQNPAEIFTVPTGAPVLLRGTLWPNRPESRLLHRSPPIEGTGETRLVLVLDPIEQTERPHASLH